MSDASRKRGFPPAPLRSRHGSLSGHLVMTRQFSMQAESSAFSDEDKLNRGSSSPHSPSSALTRHYSYHRQHPVQERQPLDYQQALHNSRSPQPEQATQRARYPSVPDNFQPAIILSPARQLLLNRDAREVPLSPPTVPRAMKPSGSHAAATAPGGTNTREDSRFLSVSSNTGNTGLVHQKSNESHDSTASFVSMASMASAGSGTGGGGGGGGVGHGAVSSSSPGYASGSETDGAAFKTDDVFEADKNPKGMWKKALSSIKQKKGSVFRKKGKKEDEPAEVDPIYHLLKCAASHGLSCGVCHENKGSPAKRECKPECREDHHVCVTCKCPCHNQKTRLTSNQAASPTTKDFVKKQ